MKTFWSIENHEMGLGFATRFALYDYVVDRQADYNSAKITTILAVVVMAISNLFKK